MRFCKVAQVLLRNETAEELDSQGALTEIAEQTKDGEAGGGSGPVSVFGLTVLGQIGPIQVLKGLRDQRFWLLDGFFASIWFWKPSLEVIYILRMFF